MTVTNNEKQLQFEIHQDAELAVLQYRYHEGQLWLMHTEVPKSLEGKGIASTLAKFAFDFAGEKGVKVKVLCPFVAVFLKRHPEYNAQVVS